MAARLTDNDYALKLDGETDDGRMLITRNEVRYDMLGGTFIHATGNFLFSGEIAGKMPKAFNDADLQIIKRDVIDTSLAVEYTFHGNDNVGLELVNNHILSWRDEIQGVPRDQYSLIFSYLGFFFNDDLSINLMSTYSKPYTSLLHSLFTTYKWNDNLSFNLDFHFVDVDDARSPLYPYRDQDQVVFKMQYQF
jgi:hypothetical protein